MKHYTFSEEEFNRFAFAVGDYIQKLGLTEWSWDVEWEQIGGGSSAHCAYDPKAKNALFRLTKTSEYDYGLQSCPERIALHEVLHLLMADFSNTASILKDEMSDVVVGHEHAVVNRLMRLIPMEVKTGSA